MSCEQATKGDAHDDDHAGAVSCCSQLERKRSSGSDHAHMPPSMESSMVVFSGFFKKSLCERHALLTRFDSSFDPAKLQALCTGGLEVEVANIMIENCIGVMGLPLGVAPTFLINGRHYVVPMCVEEPSVIAAASGAAKLVAECGGFFTESSGNVMTGEIQLLDVQNAQLAADTIAHNQSRLVEAGNRYCPNMLRRGGGVVAVSARVLQPRSVRRPVANMPYVVVEVQVRCGLFFLLVAVPVNLRRILFVLSAAYAIQINVCDAMGANVVNTVCEGLATHVTDLVGGRAGLKILTNLCENRTTTSRFRLPVSKLGWKGMDGR